MYKEATFRSELASLSETQKMICWQVYCNAASPTNNRLVAGRIGDLDLAIEKVGMTDHSGKGSVLREKDWSIFVNDAWILGGIHGHVNFELVSEVQAAVINQSYNPSDAIDRIFNVTGRELIGLTTFGYAQVYGPVEKVSHDMQKDPKRSNMLLQCVKTDLADAATFRQYQKVVVDAAQAQGRGGWGGLAGMIS
jgi:hypothetical protein